MTTAASWPRPTPWSGSISRRARCAQPAGPRSRRRRRSNRRETSEAAVAGFPLWDGVYCLVPGTPPPLFGVQNLENKRLILRLCARSLSLKKLHAKSREHGSYGRCGPGRGSVLELALAFRQMAKHPLSAVGNALVARPLERTT